MSYVSHIIMTKPKPPEEASKDVSFFFTRKYKAILKLYQLKSFILFTFQESKFYDITIVEVII